MVTPPESESELLERAEALTGRSLAEVALEHGVPVPPDLRRHKGWGGNLIERALGADAASRDEPDFRGIGVELKTLPVDRAGKPLETTFVATITLSRVGETPWKMSRVYRKLARVLWVPVQGERSIPLGKRKIATPLLWSPTKAQEDELRYDWEELAGIIGRGDVESISARLGKSLQVRPKAANSSVRRRAIDTEGAMIETLPRGFYLRTSFTAAMLRAHFALPV
jgi:DNA mismatch repair protein MutH